MIKNLKRMIRKIILGEDISNYFFAQAGEDAILQAILRNKLDKGYKGVFVDVGAYHPYRDSNTYLLYKNGWRGINIDATPGSMERFNKLRPEDINIEAGISFQEGVSNYYIISRDSTMNSFSRDNLIANGMFDSVKETILVKTYPLKTILEQHSKLTNKIDFLNVDVEGMDFEVLSSNDWNCFRPDVIAVELEGKTIGDLANNQSAQLLESLGYQIVAKNVLLENLATVFFTSKDFKYE